MLYFFDENNKYIGCRIRRDTEPVPASATEYPVVLDAGKQAHFIGGTWLVSEILSEPYIEPEPQLPTIEERVSYVETDLNEIVTILEAIV